MINKKFIQQLKKEHDARDSERRQIISLSNTILHDAKKAIFALHRDDVASAKRILDEEEKLLKNLEKKFSFERIHQEGAYKAAVEEYVEAKMFYLVMTGAKVDKIKDLKIDMESYLGGICDLTGELVRLAINKASKGDLEEVPKIKKILSDIMAELIEFDMRSYLRTKYDQAKTSLKKIEQVDYEIKIRR